MSSALPRTESARINLRTSPEAKALIERAAAIMGSTVSSFMLQNAYEAARRIVTDKDTLLLSQEAFEAFIDACRQYGIKNLARTGTITMPRYSKTEEK